MASTSEELPKGFKIDPSVQTGQSVIKPTTRDGAESSLHEFDRQAPTLPMRVAAKETLQNMLRMEEKLASNSDHIALTEAFFSFELEMWRERVAQWCYDMIDHLDFPREVAYTAMNMLDRYTATKPSRATGRQGKEAYEAAGIASLFLAIRMFGIADINANEVLRISRSSVRARDVHSAASDMIKTLTFSHQILTPTAFVKAMMGFLKKSLKAQDALSIFDQACYLVEIAVSDHHMSRVRPQKIAHASLILAMDDMRDCIDHKTSASFFEFAQQQTGLNHASAHTKSICSRLLELHDRVTHCNDSKFPHVVLDDEEEDSPRKRPCEANNIESENETVDLRPTSTTPSVKRAKHQ